MEKESSSRIMSDDEFMKLVKLAQTESNVEAMNAIFQYFDQDIKRLSKLFRSQKQLIDKGFHFFYDKLKKLGFHALDGILFWYTGSSLFSFLL